MRDVLPDMSYDARADGCVFFGSLAASWTLVRAQKVHKYIGPSILALDIISMRRFKGELKSTSTTSPLLQCPPEVFQNIKDHLYPIAVEIFTEDWMDPDTYFGKIKIDTWKRKSPYCHHQLWCETGKNVAPLLNSLRLTIPACYANRVDRDHDQDDSRHTHNFYSPVAGQYAHNSSKGVNLEPVTGLYPESQVCILNVAMNDAERRQIQTSLNALHEKYGVWFIDPPYKNPEYHERGVQGPFKRSVEEEKEERGTMFNYERGYWKEPKAKWMMWMSCADRFDPNQRP